VDEKVFFSHSLPFHVEDILKPGWLQYLLRLRTFVKGHEEWWHGLAAQRAKPSLETNGRQTPAPAHTPDPSYRVPDIAFLIDSLE
jgi:hypothetical protein